MFYRFNRSRALQVGIRAMSVLSGPKPGELPVVFEWYIELPLIFVMLFVVGFTCWLVLLLSEMAGGAGRNKDAIAAALTAVALAVA